MAAFAVVSFFLNTLGQASDVLDLLRPLSLFYHFHSDQVVTSGADAVGTTILLGTAIVATGLAALMFQRRDIGVAGGAWTKQLWDALSSVGRRNDPDASPEEAG
jgi:hypothetical protein